MSDCSKPILDAFSDAVEQCKNYRRYLPQPKDRLYKYGSESMLWRTLGLGNERPKSRPERSTQVSEANARYPLSLTDYAGMNDPNEGHQLRQYVDHLRADGEYPYFKLRTISRHFLHHDQQSEEGQRHLKAADEKTMFLSCFSLAQNSLDLWRLYGDDGRGVAFVLDPNALKEEHKLNLYRVGYMEQDIVNALDNISQPAALLLAADGKDKLLSIHASNLRGAHAELRYLFKGAAYLVEKEVRYLKSLPLSGDSDGKTNWFLDPQSKQTKLTTPVDDFFNISTLKEVIVGPSSSLRVEIVQLALNYANLTGVKVHRASHPYR